MEWLVRRHIHETTGEKRSIIPSGHWHFFSWLHQPLFSHFLLHSGSDSYLVFGKSRHTLLELNLEAHAIVISCHWILMHNNFPIPFHIHKFGLYGNRVMLLSNVTAKRDCLATDNYAWFWKVAVNWSSENCFISLKCCGWFRSSEKPKHILTKIK